MEAVDSSAELIVDYRNYDFRAVWTGRSAVDRFDQALLERSLDHLDLRRTLEIGTGFGRLTPQILRRKGEYVGADFDLGGLRDTRNSTVQGGEQRSHCAWVAANAYHLPFASGSFSSICMIRVQHHLADPLRAFREVSRVLVPGGTALITYNDRSWMRSLIHDARIVLRRPHVANDRLLLRAREGHLQVREHPTRQFITTPRRFEEDIHGAGLEIERSYGGPETVAARLLPLRLGVLGGRLWPGAPIFSTRWMIVKRSGPRTEPCPWEDILACPRCGATGPKLGVGTHLDGPCPQCGFLYRWEEGLLDARFVPGSAAASGGQAIN